MTDGQGWDGGGRECRRGSEGQGYYTSKGGKEGVMKRRGGVAKDRA